MVNVINIGGAIGGGGASHRKGALIEPRPDQHPSVSHRDFRAVSMTISFIRLQLKEFNHEQVFNIHPLFGRDEEGAQVVEYALIIAVVSIGLVIALTGLDGNFRTFIAASSSA